MQATSPVSSIKSPTRQNGPSTNSISPSQRPKPVVINSSSSVNSKRTVSPSTTRAKGPSLTVVTNEPTLQLDPDDLFTNKTIAEVRTIQLQLRSDAESKQEELRLMVGERYRDLLQASTSIISIAASSKSVRTSLKDAKALILAQSKPSAPRQPAQTKQQDKQLQALQLLSAHIKLLLDAPEHLWRLIERQKYFQAAWLFLLARVVHRALVREAEDEDDETSWSSHGISVMEQFPLVKRQWDTVSHFKSQITHKAGLSLRISGTQAPNTCATLMALHLLDARPLNESLSIFLEQRSKSLNTLLSKRLDIESTKSNGDAAIPKNKPQGVKHAMQSALSIISDTVSNARGVFETEPALDKSMIESTMEYVQSDSPGHLFESSLPKELLLTTQTLLTTIPSSQHLLMLPPNLRSFKPYVDLSSPNSRISQSHLTQKLSEWLHASVDRFQTASDRWLGDIDTVHDVWRLRLWCRRWVHGHASIEESERAYIKKTVDTSSKQRITRIWKDEIKAAQTTFKSHLYQSFSELANSDESPGFESLYRLTPLPTHSILASASASAFSKYQDTLLKQLGGRHSRLAQLLSPLEDFARSLKSDIDRASRDTDAESEVLLQELNESYTPEVDALCRFVAQTLREVCREERKTATSLTFIVQVADHLLHGSFFIEDVACTKEAASNFHKLLADLTVALTGQLRTKAVKEAVDLYWRTFSSTVAVEDAVVCPSPALLKALLVLVELLTTLEVYKDPARLSSVASDTLHAFADSLVGSNITRWERNANTAIADLEFLQLLLSAWPNAQQELESKVTKAKSRLQTSRSDLSTTASEAFKRSRILLATLLPSTANNFAETKAVTGLQGLPNTLSIAPPSSRFGLLLVGET